MKLYEKRYTSATKQVDCKKLQMNFSKITSKTQ